jgi:CRISPR/Cas system-associated protein Csx1
MDSRYCEWRKASYSNGNAECVEIGHASGAIAVRDTKNRDGVVLAVPASAWHTFIGSLK